MEEFISIELSPQNGRGITGGPKSIISLRWDRIPQLAIISGPNGSGKSQLLEAIYHSILNKQAPHKIVIEGDQFSGADVVYIPIMGILGDSATVGLAALQEIKRSVLANIGNNPGDPVAQRQAKRLARLSGKSTEEFRATINSQSPPIDYSVTFDERATIRSLASLFFAYRLKAAGLREKGADLAEIASMLGDPPWEIVDRILASAGLDYRCRSPLEVDLDDYYNLKFFDRARGVEIDAQSLSSGERVILHLVGLILSYRHLGNLPRLLLLDEPDAHLHPSLAFRFLKFLSDTFVNFLGMRVIMTTHSPSSVAWAPPNSLFVMSRDEPRIAPATSKTHVINLLTSGLSVVADATKFVLVEDVDDSEFYKAVREILIEGSGLGDAEMLATPSLVFIPSSSKEGARKQPGGKTVVRSWIEKLGAAVLLEVLVGLVDRDDDGASAPRLFVTGRRSIENYLFDPLLLYAMLLEHGKAPSVPDVALTAGNEHLVRALSSQQLDNIVICVSDLVSPHLGVISDKERLPTKVAYPDKVINYPSWWIDKPKGELRSAVQLAFAPYLGANSVNQQRLTIVMRRVRLVPNELRDTLKSIQSYLPPD